MSACLDVGILLPNLLPESGSATVDAFLDGLTSAPLVGDFARG